MQIFFLDIDPKQAAQWHGDKHVNKLITEACQLLSMAYRYLSGEKPGHPIDHPWCKKCLVAIGYSPYAMAKSYINHPCTRWVRHCLGNFIWTVYLGLELCQEKEQRWPENKPHKCKTLLTWFIHNLPPAHLFSDPNSSYFTVPNLAIGPDYSQCLIQDENPYTAAVLSYRKYYKCKMNENVVYYRKLPDRCPMWLK